MIDFYRGEAVPVRVRFCREMPADLPGQGAFVGCKTLFTGKYAETLFVPCGAQTTLLIGVGHVEDAILIGAQETKDLCATAAKELKAAGVVRCAVDVALFWQAMGEEAIAHAVMGFILGTYSYGNKQRPAEATSGQKNDYEIFLDGTPQTPQQETQVKEAQVLACGVLFTRDIVNRPGNLLRPMDFERAAVQFLEGTGVESQLLVLGELRTAGLNLLAGVGGGGEYPPCLLVLRYRGGRRDTPVTALVGKGVTCDTGGYCLKKAASMAGIKGDMAGAAAVVGAMYALAKNHVPVNVTACLPLCENRITPLAMLPGDVLTAYNGTTVEILNTDAEGRLILADAVAYAVKAEHAARVIDIATLTGAVWAALGYTITGALCDNEALYAAYASASVCSAERHLRFPFGREHSKMLESTVADIKNTGSDCCGAITAGLFIRTFAGGVPWLHLDIAGTAWVQTPNYAFEQPGATGVGVASLYALMQELAKGGTQRDR